MYCRCTASCWSCTVCSDGGVSMSEFLDCASLFVEEEDYELLKPRSDAERKQAERARMDEEQQELQKKKDRIRHQTYDPTVRRARRNNPETRPAYRRQERDRYG